MSRRALAAVIGAAVVAAALLAMGDAIAGSSGMADAACAEAIAGLLAIRGWLGRSESPGSVRDDRTQHRKPRRAARADSSAAAFPGFGAIVSDVTWAGAARGHDGALWRRLSRLAAAKGVAPGDLAGTEARAGDEDGPGLDPAAIERLISWLEDR